jgi:hypothetical protein
MSHILANPYQFERIIQRDPVDLTAAANTIVWNPGTSTVHLFKVWFNLVNPNTTTARTCIVGEDRAATGALLSYWFYEVLPALSQSGWLGPFVMTGNDDLMAWQTVGTDVDLSLFILQQMQPAVDVST